MVLIRAEDFLALSFDELAALHEMIVSRDLTFVLSHVGSSFVLLLWADPIPASGLF